VTVAFGHTPTEVGDILVAVTDLGVAATHFHDSSDTRDRIATRLGLPVVDDPARVAHAVDELTNYFAGTLREFTVELDWRLTSQSGRTVLSTLHSRVPYGQTVTYGELSHLSGTNIPPRAIGGIMGSNPIPIIVPCHRVLASNGLGGFSGGEGVESKRRLLTMEGYLPPTLF
jgi:methylated-DNA-[protein]-cysteine S-methyltransferase